MNARRLSRLVLVQLAYEAQHNEQKETIEHERIEELVCLNAYEKLVPNIDFINGLWKFWIDEKDEYKSLLTSFLKKTAYDRVPLLIRCIIEVAICELKNQQNVPGAIIIDEYVSLARFFSFDSQISFVHGILANIVNTLRPDEEKR